MLTDFAKGKTCEVCGKPAAGSGDGVWYCNQHFWESFDAMESNNANRLREIPSKLENGDRAEDPQQGE